MIVMVTVKSEYGLMILFDIKKSKICLSNDCQQCYYSIQFTMDESDGCSLQAGLLGWVLQAEPLGGGFSSIDEPGSEASLRAVGGGGGGGGGGGVGVIVKVYSHRLRADDLAAKTEILANHLILLE